MDPNANLDAQRQITQRIMECIDSGDSPNYNDCYRLAELVQALDAWLVSGGFLPNDWEQNRSK